MHTNLKAALRAIIKQNLPFIVEGTVVKVNSGGTCDVIPITESTDEKNTVIYYEVPYPSTFSPEVNTFVLIGFIDELTPYVIYTDKISGINIGTDNKTNSAIPQEVKTELEKQLISNKGALVKDGAFRYQLNQSGIISVNGTYYGWITIEEAALIEIFKNAINIAVNEEETGKIYIGKTKTKIVKEFKGVDVLAVNAINDEMKEDNIKATRNLKYYKRIIDVLAKAINENQDTKTFYNIWNQFVAKSKSAAKFIAPTVIESGANAPSETPEISQGVKIAINDILGRYDLTNSVNYQKNGLEYAAYLTSIKYLYANPVLVYYDKKNLTPDELAKLTFRKEDETPLPQFTQISEIKEIEESGVFFNIKIDRSRQNSKSSPKVFDKITLKVLTNKPNRIAYEQNGYELTNVPTDEAKAGKEINITQEFLLDRLSAVLGEMSGKREEKIDNEDYNEATKLLAEITVKDNNSPVPFDVSIIKDVETLTKYLYAYDFHLLSPATIKSIVDQYKAFYSKKDSRNGSDDYPKLVQNLTEYWNKIKELAEKGKNVDLGIDLTVVESIQSENLISLNEILNDMSDTIKELAANVQSLINAGAITPAGGGPVTYTGFAQFSQDMYNRSQDIIKIKQDIDSLLATEMTDTNRSE